MKAGLFICTIFFIVGLAGAASGGIYRGFFMAAWAYKGVALVGGFGILWHLYAMKKAKNKPAEPQLPLDEQCVQAKADLDQMYFREHGKMPEWPDKEEKKKENQ